MHHALCSIRMPDYAPCISAAGTTEDRRVGWSRTEVFGEKELTETSPGTPVGGDLADGLQATCGSVLLELNKVGLHNIDHIASFHWKAWNGA